MWKPFLIKTGSLLFFVSVVFCATAQPDTKIKQHIKAPVAKPYKVLTNGKQITVQSKLNIQSVMVWTASGHRIVEEKNINETAFVFTVVVKEKIFFVMIEFADGKRFTEKIGLSGR